MRIEYVHGRVGRVVAGGRFRRSGYVIAAREVHVLYESEGLPGEEFIGGMKYVRREGRPRSRNNASSSRQPAERVARAWVVQLLVQQRQVVEWPDGSIKCVRPSKSGFALRENEPIALDYEEVGDEVLMVAASGTAVQ